MVANTPSGENCEFYQSENLDQTTAAEFLWNGDSTQMRNCTVGSLADASAGSIIRPCVKLRQLPGRQKCRDGPIQNTSYVAQRFGHDQYVRLWC